jgi:hypothetical protein
MSENIPFDKFLAPAEPPEQTKKGLRGDQPGNLNALKHGLYVEGNTICNLTPIERANLCDFNDIIVHSRNSGYQKSQLPLLSNHQKTKNDRQANVLYITGSTKTNAHE